MAAKSAKYLCNFVRCYSVKPSTNNEITPYLYNRNPRNLERLGLDRKPTGFPLDNYNIEFWHKLEVKETDYYVKAKLIHNTNKVVVEASTNEWAIYKQLHSKKDKMAYITLAKVFAERCLETGIYSFACYYSREYKNEPSKIHLFLDTLEKEDLILQEMAPFDIHKIWHLKREKKPWTVLES